MDGCLLKMWRPSVNFSDINVQKLAMNSALQLYYAQFCRYYLIWELLSDILWPVDLWSPCSTEHAYIRLC